MKKNNFLNKNWTLLIIILLSSFSVLSIFFKTGIFSMHDSTQLARIYEMAKSFKQGNFPVRWVNDLGYSYGYPIFNFYSPFAYYLGAILFITGLPLIFSTKVIFALAVLFSGLSMFIFIKKMLGNLPALVAAIIYVYFPYHAVNLYVRGDLAELFAYSLLPLVFLGTFKIFLLKKDENIFSYYLLLSVSIAGVILSHNLSSLMLLVILLLALIVFLLFFRLEFKKIFLFFSALITGFLLSAFYAIPALLEIKYTNVYSQVGGTANFIDHFVCLRQLWYSPWGYGGSAKGCIDGISFALGKSNILFSVFSILLLFLLFFRKKIKMKEIQLSVLFLLIFSIFMLLPESESIWKKLPYFAFLQYPWRFLNFVSLFMSFLIGLFIFNLKGKSKKIVIFFSIFIIGFTIFYNLKLFKAQYYIDFGNKYYESKNYLNWTASKISDEYLPKNFKKPDKINNLAKERIEIYKGKAKVISYREKINLINLSINVETPSIIKINLAYFPAWQIFLNKQKINFNIKNDGLYVDLPVGLNYLIISFNQTKVEIVANLISLITLLSLFIAIIRAKLTCLR